MHVVATAGHVDHGKSSLVDALTGMRSDRLAEEQRRGLSIELGYTWTRLAGADGREDDVAFVDVPGHERFVTTMLAGVGPVPVALLVVAADDPWMPQAAEHLAALDALAVAHGVVAVTRSDLADPAEMVARAGSEIASTSLHGSPIVPVSAHTGAGLDELRAALTSTLAAVPVPDPGADVRLWVDRRFSVRGSGTVVTATLPAGTVRRGDLLAWRGGTVRVRGLQTLGRETDEVVGVARVALNLAGDGLAGLGRGEPLTTPGAHLDTVELDVRVVGDPTALPAAPVLHVGASDQVARTRPLADDVVRLRLEAPLPLRVGDRALLRDPGSRRVWGITVLDPAPPALTRRGAARDRAATLADASYAAEVHRRGVVATSWLRRVGVVPTSTPEVVEVGDWVVSATRADELATEVDRLVADRRREAPLSPGLALTALAARLDVPVAVVASVVPPHLRVVDGVVGAAVAALPAGVERAVTTLADHLGKHPFDAPTADRLRELGLDDRGQAAAARAGLLLRVAPGIVLLPAAEQEAVRRLAQLPQPFTTSQARQELDTSRRVALPLLDHLDRTGVTRRLPDDRREVR